MSLQNDLHELFLLDQQIRGLRTRQDAAARRRDAQQKKHEQLSQQQLELNDQVKQSKASVGLLEVQAQGIEDRIKELRDRMNTVTSNKEYSALLLEVNTLKEEKSKFEDQELKEMEQVEQMSRQLAEVEQKMAEVAKIVEGAEKEFNEARASVGDRLDELTEQRSGAASKVPEEALTAFEKLLDTHDGEAMAVVIEESRKHLEYTCGGCYIGIPAERVSTLMSRPNELVTCPSCGRILYLGQDLKSSIPS